MASFTGKGETRPTVVGTEVKEVQRVEVSDVHGALSRPSPRERPLGRKVLSPRAQEKWSQRFSISVCLWSHVTTQIRNGR